MHSYEKIAASFYNKPLLITHEKLQEIQGFLEIKFAGMDVSAEDVNEVKAAIVRGEEQRAGAVAVLPVFGVIAPRSNMMMDWSGGVSLQMLTKRFRALVDDTSVGAIILNIDSPGGSVEGLPEFANEVFNARSKKKIVAIANTMACSAAYWIGTAADEFVAMGSSWVGSIGVYSIHHEFSKALEEEGIATTIIKAGKFKVEGNEFEALSDEAQVHMQENIDHWYDMFINAVAKNRGVKVADVKNGFGEGRYLPAELALKENMIDGIETLDELITRLSVPASQKSRSRASERDRNLRLASV